MTIQFINNARTTLLGALAAGTGSMPVSVPYGFAALIQPTLANGPIQFVLTQAGSSETSWEDVQATAAVTGTSGTGDTVTVTRAQEGTSSAAWPAGSKFEARITAQGLNGLGGSAALSLASIAGSAINLQAATIATASIPTELSTYASGSRQTFGIAGQAVAFSGILTGKQSGSPNFYRARLDFAVVNNGGVVTIIGTSSSSTSPVSPLVTNAIELNLTGVVTLSLDSNSPQGLIINVASGEPNTVWSFAWTEGYSTYA